MVPRPGLEPGELSGLNRATLPICPAGRAVSFGLGGRPRTCDLRIPSPALFQLSYTQTVIWRLARDSNPFPRIDSAVSYPWTSKPMFWMVGPDSNRRCTGSKPVALPLGYPPSVGALWLQLLEMNETTTLPRWEAYPVPVSAVDGMRSSVSCGFDVTNCDGKQARNKVQIHA